MSNCGRQVTNIVKRIKVANVESVAAYRSDLEFSNRMIGIKLRQLLQKDDPDRKSLLQPVGKSPRGITVDGTNVSWTVCDTLTIPASKNIRC